MRNKVRPTIVLDLAVDAGEKLDTLANQVYRTTSDRRLPERNFAKIFRATAHYDFESAEELNAFVSDYVKRGLPEEGPPLTPLQQAQELVYDAWETKSVTERWRLAKQALRLSPDCADAYILLAEAAEPDLWEALRLYQEGVAAGERALDPGAFSPTDDLENWWGELTRRPYLRARARLASALWRLGRWTEAVVHLQDLLRLNPKDNQGLRFRLFNWLVFLGEEAPVKQLLGAYPEEDSAAWRYTLALWTFRQEGPSPEAARQLRLAWARNPYVPGFLLELISLPGEPPEIYQPGDEAEAIVYALEALPIWRQVEGALRWLAETLAEELNSIFRPARKVGRNEPCPCGSGKKYKQCCLGREVALTIQSSLGRRTRHWRIDEVQAMSTPDILAKLASFGLTVTEEDVWQGAGVHPSAEALSEAWIASHEFTASGFDQDFPWFAAWTLWERLNLRPLPIETVHELVWKERDRRDSDRLPNPDNWLRAWAYLKEHVRRMGLHSLDEAEKALELDFSLGFWFVEFITGLSQEVKEDPSYLVALLTELREFLTLFSAAEMDIPEAGKLEQALRCLEEEAHCPSPQKLLEVSELRRLLVEQLFSDKPGTAD